MEHPIARGYFAAHVVGMFLRRSRRSRNGDPYESWSLMRTVRTARRPRHELVANLGKAPGLAPDTRRGWEHVADLLDGRGPRGEQGQLGQSMPPAAPAPRWTQVDVSAVRVERVRDFGEVYLALALWRTLEMWLKGMGLGDCARQLLKEVSTVRNMDVVLQARPDSRSEPAELRLRVVARPDPPVAALLQQLGLEMPHAPKIVQNVVPQNGACEPETVAIPASAFRKCSTWVNPPAPARKPHPR